MQKAHSEVVLLQCIDPRFRLPVEALICQLMEVIPGQVTAISIGGSGKCLATRSTGDQGILQSIQIGIDKHGAKSIAVVFHEDCGGYGGAESFPSRDAEFGCYERDAISVSKLLSQRFPRISVRTFLATMHDRVVLKEFNAAKKGDPVMR